MALRYCPYCVMCILNDYSEAGAEILEHPNFTNRAKTWKPKERLDRFDLEHCATIIITLLPCWEAILRLEYSSWCRSSASRPAPPLGSSMLAQR